MSASNVIATEATLLLPQVLKHLEAGESNYSLRNGYFEALRLGVPATPTLRPRLIALASRYETGDGGERLSMVLVASYTNDSKGFLHDCGTNGYRMRVLLNTLSMLDPCTEERVDEWIRIADEPTVWVRSIALDHLVKCVQLPSCRRRELDFLEDPDTWIRVSAIRLLSSKLRADLEFEVRCWYHLFDPDSIVREEAALSLRRLLLEPSTERIGDAVLLASEYEKLATTDHFQGLATRFGGQSALPLLKVALLDDSQSVRVMACVFLLATGPDNSVRKMAQARLASEKDVVVRELLHKIVQTKEFEPRP